MKRNLAALILALAVSATGCDTPGVASNEQSLSQDRAKDSSTAETKEPAKPVPSKRVLNKTFDDLAFDILPDAPFKRSMLTPAIEDLSGRRITIRGFILPTAQKRGIKQFVLVRDNLECCFGPGAALYDCILIDMAPGKSAEFSIFPVAVTGEFRIEQFPGPEGRPLAVFQMRGEKVE